MSDIPFLRRASIVLSFAVGALPLGCGDQAEQEPSYTLVSAHPTDVSIAGLSSELQAQFGEGERIEGHLNSGRAGPTRATSYQHGCN